MARKPDDSPVTYHDDDRSTENAEAEAFRNSDYDSRAEWAEAQAEA